MNGKMRPAPNCDAQIPLLSKVGRGIQGNSFKVEAVDSPSGDATYLEGYLFNETEKAWTKQWTSGNVNGGKLSVDYEYRSFTMPPTFVIKFTYSRPGHEDWVEKTPPIPYDPTGAPGTVGSYVGSVYFREWAESGVDNWQQLVIAPEGTDIPARGADWSVSLEAGVRGSLKLVTSSDLEAALDCTNEVLQMMAAGIPLPYHGAKNVRDYIDKADAATLESANEYTDATLESANEYTDDAIADIVVANAGLEGRMAKMTFGAFGTANQKNGRVEFYYTPAANGLFMMRVACNVRSPGVAVNYPTSGDPEAIVWRRFHELLMGDVLGTVQVPAGVCLPVPMLAANSFTDYFMLDGVDLTRIDAWQSAAGTVSGWGAGTYAYTKTGTVVERLADEWALSGTTGVVKDTPGSVCTQTVGTVKMDIVYQGAHVYLNTGYDIEGWYFYRGPLAAPVEAPKMPGYTYVRAPQVDQIITDTPTGVSLKDIDLLDPAPNGQKVEYMVETSAAGNGGVWQDSRTFYSVGAGSRVFHARIKENAYYQAGFQSTATLVIP